MKSDFYKRRSKIIDGSIVQFFVEDEAEFSKSANESVLTLWIRVLVKIYGHTTPKRKRKR